MPVPSSYPSSKASLSSPSSISTTGSAGTESPLSSNAILGLSAAVKESTSAFSRLFPEPGVLEKTLNRPRLPSSKDRAPWLNQSMSQGTALEESIRKAVFEREPIDTWWPLYEQLSSTWTNRIAGDKTPITALTRTDFVRLITSIKVSTHPARIERLERLFEDFHLAMHTPKSNVRVYTSFLETIQYWKLQKQFPLWIQRIRSKIAIMPAVEPFRESLESVSPPSSFCQVRENPQEQYHDLMRALANVNLLEPMIQCLQEFKSSQSHLLKPSTMAYDTVLESLMRNGDTPRAMALVQEMKDQGLSPQLTTFNILLSAHLENKDARAAQRVLESLLLSDLKPDIYTFNILMSGYLNMGDFELVSGFYKGLGEYGLVPNAKTYRILLKSHLKQKQYQQVIDLFCQLKDSPRPELHPGSEDYRILIQALTSQHKMPEALGVLQEMIDNGKVPVTSWIYNVFLTQYARQGEVEKARRILDMMVAEKLPLVDGSINPLIQAYLARKDLDSVAEMTELMTRFGIQPTSTTFNIMINSTKTTGNLDAAMRLYECMKAEGVAPNVWTFNTLLDILIGKLASRMGSTMARKGSAHVVTDAEMEEYIPKIERLLQEMNACGIKPDAVTYGKLIHQYVILQDMEQAEMLFHEMVKSGIPPDNFVFNTLMNGFATAVDMDKAVELFRRMPKYGVEPDATTFTTLIKGYANMQELALAEDFANSLQQRHSKIQLDQHCFHTLMQLAQKSHQPGMALDFFEMMRGRGMEPDRITFTILLNALSRDYAGDTSHSGQNRRRGSSVSRKHGVDGIGGGVGTGSRERRGGASAGRTTGFGSASTKEAAESILNAMMQKESQPLTYTQITTIIAAYFRLGRPQAAIEFFKSSYWKAEPKLSTSNCEALFQGLLAPELGRRYDGLVLNLYSKMLNGTIEKIRAEEEYKRQLEAFELSKEDSDQKSMIKQANKDKDKVPRDMSDWSKPRSPWADSSFVAAAAASSSASSTLPRSLTMSTPTSSATRANASFAFESRYGLPSVDLLLIRVLLRAFGQRQNWGIVLRLWQDVEMIGEDRLYPYKLPLDILGWGAQAYHMTSRKEEDEDEHLSKQQQQQGRSSPHHSGRPATAEGGDDDRRVVRSGLQQPEGSQDERAEMLLRRLWRANHKTGVEWSYRIYGYNIFSSSKSTLSSPLSDSRSSSTSPTSLPSTSTLPSSSSPSPSSPDWASSSRDKKQGPIVSSLSS